MQRKLVASITLVMVNNDAERISRPVFFMPM